ncbi:MAG: tetratricopeptide repeat protein [Chitinophagales bacterium]
MKKYLIIILLFAAGISCNTTSIDVIEEETKEEEVYNLEELEAIYQNAKSAYGMDNYQEAFSFYQDASDYADKLAEQGVYSNLKHLSLFEMGTINAYHNNYYEGAIEYYKKSIEIDEEKFGECTWLIPAFNNIGHCYYQVSDFENSIFFYEKLLALQSDNESALVNLCYCNGNLGKWELAMSYCEEASNQGSDAAIKWLEKHQ